MPIFSRLRSSETSSLPSIMLYGGALCAFSEDVENKAIALAMLVVGL